MVVRYGMALLLGALVTFGLFWLMQFLIIGQTAQLDESGRVKLIDFVRLQREPELQTKDRKPPDRPPPPETPPEPPQVTADNVAPSANALSISSAGLETNLDIGGPGAVAAADTEEVPLFRVLPQYPERAASRGIEGYVEMEFTITESGGVTNIKVLSADPPGMFERAAIKAMEKWKYKPKIVEGKPVARHGQRVRMPFQLQG